MAASFTNAVRSGLALAKQMRGDNDCPINCIYIEYENVAGPGDTATAPAATTTEGLEYYDNLPDGQDFIRAPLLGLPPLSIASGYSPYFGDGEGNTVTFSAMTAAVAGELGRPFTNGANSKVYGLALVCVQDWTDRSRDVVVQRAYYADEPDQVLKPASGSFQVTYPITFGG